MKKTMLLMVLSLYCGAASLAQTFHAIVFCNTIDPDIGPAVVIDYNNMSRHLAIVEKQLENDYVFNICKLDGSHCTRANLKALIDGLEVGPDDVVMAYYSGHGAHAPQNESDPWPQFCMNTLDESLWLPMSSLDKWIEAKNPRLRIIVAQCCNVVMDGVTVKPLSMWASKGRATPMDGFDGGNYRKLFSVRGRVMSTSSELGQYSWCRGDIGSLYTNHFLNSFASLGKGGIEAGWQPLLSTTKALMDKERIRDAQGRTWIQNPYFQVNVSEGGERRVTKRDDGHSTKDTGTLEEALMALVDKRIAVDRRLGMIDAVNRRYFHPGQKVVTIAADMKTAVDYEEPVDFLRRVCLSDYVSGISVLSVGDNIIKVHELK